MWTDAQSEWPPTYTEQDAEQTEQAEQQPNYKINSPVENQNDLELDFKVFFFVDSCCVGIVLDESN